MPLIQLVGDNKYDISIMAIVLNEEHKPLFGKSSLCFYGKTRVFEPSRRIGERLPRELATLTEDFSEFCYLNNEDDTSIIEQITWDHRYPVVFAITCHEKNPDLTKRTMKNWKGKARIILNGKEICSLDTNDLGDLSKTGCLQICITDPVKNSFKGFFGSKLSLPITGDIVKYSHAGQWLAEFGIV